jgi:signal transduction histidine kinase
MLAVSVANAGPPITPADRKRIFEPFVQLDSSLTRSAAGVGLGLHIVRRLVESYGGMVDVDSADGLVTFTVTVPAVLPAPADGTDPEPAVVGAPHQPNG